MSDKTLNYADAGVDIDKTNKAIKSLSPLIETTFSQALLNPLGGFAALYDLKAIMANYAEPVLVQSVDGLGTKTIIARLMQQYHQLGYDLVAATANDILVYGAKPLSLLDYVASDALEPETLKELLQGMIAACKQSKIALIGGETAEMPGIYRRGEYDVVGMITGVVDKAKIIQGSTIQPGDAVFAFASSGLHSNGYSLARHLLFHKHLFKLDAYRDDLGQTLGEALLEPHLNYTEPVLSMLEQGIIIKGMAHISGGGIIDNLPRVLPDHCAIEINKHRYPNLPLFSFLQSLAPIAEQELYRTFNMGIGYVLIGAQQELSNAAAYLTKHESTYKLYYIGHVVEGKKEVHLCA
ncbi:phosphoribosylformylglycinamidine cyclo-ligase [Legionella sp. km772]|uniref:phosphoribosylformylglycinamidine cyclo-ligase n=1 Tax=Legionella sp. km772 TaxID=2498111 RepID=UPI000F8CFFDA|nr:phosphoribosylformylglycinamidine cyclo-ligase [Legionella sp. km772]RUR11338.1 phosphoribosylformylglycinamidine cyclo-ligase [Legionella sp. km772]